MKKTKLLILSLALVAFVFSAMPAAAQYPDDLNLIPITDAEWWEVEAEGQYVPIGTDGAYIDAKIGSDGSVTLKKTNNVPDGMNWPRIRTVTMEEPVLVDLAETPYLYYDFTVEGESTQWALGLIFEGGAYPLSFAQQIYRDQGLGEIAATDDGKAGTFKGRVDINKVVEANPSPLAKPNAKLELHIAQIFIVDPTTDGTITLRSLYIGGDNDGAAENTSTAAPEESKPETTTNTTTTPAKTFDPGMAALAMTGIAGLIGSGVLVVTKKRK